MKLQHRVLEFIVAFAVLFGAYLWVGHYAVESYKDEQRIVHMEADKAQRLKYDALAQDYEVLKVKRQVNAKTTVREVEKVVDRIVYRNDCIDADGLRIINDSLSGATASKFNSAVHAP